MRGVEDGERNMTIGKQSAGSPHTGQTCTQETSQQETRTWETSQQETLKGFPYISR